MFFLYYIPTFAFKESVVTGKAIKNSTKNTQVILDFLTQTNQRKTIAEISNDLHISISKVSGCITCLKKRGLVATEKVDNKNYHYALVAQLDRATAF